MSTSGKRKRAGNAVIPPEIKAATARGCKFIPLEPRGKKPLIRDWQKTATSDIETLKKWAVQFPNCNWGWAIPVGYFVIDADGVEGKCAIYALGHRFPATLTFKTGKGRHYVLTSSAAVRNSVGKVSQKVDVRAPGGFIVYPGSIHANGGKYEVINDVPVAEAPQWLLDKMDGKVETKPAKRPAKDHEDVAAGGRNAHLTSVAGTLRKHGKSSAEIEVALFAENLLHCKPELPENEVLGIARSVSRYQIPEDVQNTLNDSARPKVLLQGDDRLLSDTAAELGEHLSEKLDLYNGNVVVHDEGTLRVVSVQEFRTRVERYVVCVRMRSSNRVSFEVGVTMSESDARGILASNQFKDKLRRLKRLNTCRLPVPRVDGSIALLSEGYDSATETLTVSNVDYAEDMPFATGVEAIKDLLREFKFADGDRSMAVAVAALISLFVAQLIPEGELRPSITVTKNAEGAGATTVVACAIVTVLGDLPTSVKSEDDAEIRKILTAAVREGRTVVLFDNVKGKINSQALEAFVSTSTWSDRLLGANETVSGPNNVTVFCTANGATVSPDWRRRTLFIELHLDTERAEDQVFERPLSVGVLKTMRPDLLAACWSLIRNWDSMGRPLPTRSHSAFPAWARIVGGIVEAAGFACPLATASVAAVADEDGDYMRLLAAAMQHGRKLTFQEVTQLCRVQEIFGGLVGDSEMLMTTAHRSAFGKVLGRYDNRLVGDSKFMITGKGHQRRYHVVPTKPPSTVSTVEHGVPVELAKTPLKLAKGKDRATVLRRSLHNWPQNSLSKAAPSVSRQSISKRTGANNNDQVAKKQRRFLPLSRHR